MQTESTEAAAPLRPTQPLPVRARRRLRALVEKVPHRVRATLVAAGLAGGVLTLAFVGGAVSGKLEHRPSKSAIAPPTTGSTTSTSTTTTSTTSPGHAADVQAVKLAVVEDMTLDVTSQRLDPDVHKRLALAETPAAIAKRHADITLAWAPDKVAATQTAYDAAVRANAGNPKAPSVTDGAFVVTSWGEVTTDGTTATAACRGHYRLLEPTNPSAVGGAVELPDGGWQISLRKSTARWRLEDRTTTGP